MMNRVKPKHLQRGKCLKGLKGSLDMKAVLYKKFPHILSLCFVRHVAKNMLKPTSI